MTKEEFLWCIDVKKELEFLYDGTVYTLSYGNDQKGSYIAFGVRYEPKIFRSLGELLNEARIQNHFLREMLDVIPL